MNTIGIDPGKGGAIAVVGPDLEVLALHDYPGDINSAAALAALFISPLKAILVILLFIAIQQIDNYIITPNVMRYQVRVHPGLIIFSLIAGGALFGFWGLIIAVPTVAILQETLRYYLLDKNKPTSR